MAVALSLAPSNLSAQTGRAAPITLREGRLADALRELAIQSGTGILFSPEIVRGLRVARLSGTMPVERLLERLLSGTGLTYRRTAAGTFVIQPMIPPRPAADTVSRAEDIIVTGANRAGAIKQASDTEIDVITELEARRLPNLDVSDVLLRLPGMRRNDTQSGENRYVSIRGMNNAAASQSIDGVLLTTYVARSRAPSTEAITAAFLKTITVSTAGTPDLDENSNSAHVAMTTISGLDAAGGRLLDIRLLGGTNSRSGGLQNRRQPLRASATWRGQLDPDGRVGLALGAGLDRLGSRQDAVSVAGYRSIGGRFVPDGALTQGQTYTRTQRLSAMARIDFQPNDRLSLFAEYFFMAHRYVTDQFTSTITVSADDAQPTSATSGQFSRGSATYSLNHLASPLIRDHLFQLGADFRSNAGELLSFRFGATLNQGRQKGVSISGFTAGSTILSTPIGYFFSGSRLSLSPGTSASLADPANYTLNGKLSVTDFENRDRNYFARADYAFNAGPADRGFGMKLGSQVKTLSVDDEQRGYARILAAGQSISLSDVATSPSVTLLKPVEIDEAKLLALIDQRGIAPSDANGLYEADPADGYGQSFTGTERVIDLYGIASYGFGRARLSVGMRAAHTRRTLQDYEPDGSGVWNSAHYRQSYWDFLPAIYGHYAASDRLKLRGVLSRTMERPPITTSARRYLTSYDTPVTRSISYTDPYLKPTRSNNAEASAEYVYGPYHGFVTFSLFAKELHDIPAVSTLQSIGADGVREIVSYTTNVSRVNGKKVFGRMRGLELAWSEPQLALFPRRLGSLGLMLSYSYIVYRTTALNGGNGVAATDTRLVDAAPRHYFNAAFFYKNGPFSANASVQQQSSVPTLSYDPANDRRTYYGPLVDLQIGYALSPNVRIMMEGRNLVDQKIVDRYGTTGYGPAYQVRRNGRTAWAGVQFNLF